MSGKKRSRHAAEYVVVFFLDGHTPVNRELNQSQFGHDFTLTIIARYQEFQYLVLQ